MANVAQIYIDGEILPEAYIWPDDTATSLYRVRNQIKAAGEFDRIKLNIFSPGGYCLEGWAIVDYLLSLGYPIDTLAYGQCASFGTVFHTMGETREIMAHTEYVVHRPWDFFIGNDLQIDEQNAALKLETARLFEYYSERIGKTVDELSAGIQKEDLKLTPQETVTWNFSTAIFQPSPAARASINNRQLSKPSYLLSLKDKKINPNAPYDGPAKDLQTNKTIIMAGLKSSLEAAAKSVLAFIAGTDPKALDNKLKDGRTLVTDSTGDTPVVGDPATIDGQTAPDADYELESGIIVTVKDGSVSNVNDPSQTDNSNAGDTSTDPVDLSTDTPVAVALLRKEHGELKAQLKASTDKYEALEERVTKVLGSMVSQEPNTQANRQPKGAQNTELNDREQMLADHVAKYAKKPRAVVNE